MAIQTLRFEQYINASPAQVLHAFTNASALRQWLCDLATVEPRPGGRVYLSWNSGYYAAGEYTVVEPEHHLEFTWWGRSYPAASTVRVDLEPQNGGAHLTLEHTLPDDTDAWISICEQVDKGWSDSLDNLASTLETGLDLRFINRPVLGIFFGEFNPEIARELGVPVAVGVRIDGTVEGLGARAAGLTGGDVIIQIGDTVILNFNDIPAALGGWRAGQHVPVVFYRGPKKIQVEMELSRRPLPDIPAGTIELAHVLRPRFDAEEFALEALFEGVSASKASAHPAPGEWSALEVLSHLIHGKRFDLNDIVQTVAGFEPWSDDWDGNLDAQVRATAAAFPTAAELIGEIKRLNAEIVALFENLPSEFSQTNRNGFWRLAYAALESPYHLEGHTDQIKAAIAAAKEGQSQG